MTIQPTTSTHLNGSSSWTASPPPGANVIEALAQASLNPSCDNCNQPNAPLHCMRCHVVSYCTRACQRSAWKTHKALCDSGLIKLLEPLPADDEVVCKFRRGPSSIFPLTQRGFRLLTGASFARYFKATKEVIAAFQQESQSVARSPLIFPEQVQAFEQNPPELHLIEAPLSKGLGVSVGSRPIKEGDIICFYVGDYRLQKDPKSSKPPFCHYKDVDSSNTSGLGAFINDGPPNCEFDQIANYKGIPSAIVVTALRDLAPREALFLNYGLGHAVYDAAYRICSFDMKQLKNHCLKGRFYTISLIHSLFMINIYIASRPIVLLRLLLEGALDLVQAEEIVWTFIKWMWEEDHLERHRKNVSEIFTIAQHLLALKDRELVKEVISSLLSDLRLLTIITVLFYAIEEGPKLTVEKIKEYKILGLLLDQVHLVLNRTVTGTYQKHDKKTKVEGDLGYFEELYVQLSSQNKERLERYLKAVLQTCDEQNCVKEKAALQRFMQALKEKNPSGCIIS